MESLETLMQANLPEGGVATPYGRNSHMEIAEVATGRVWMSVDPATQQDFDELKKTLDDSLRGLGVGVASMDAALFRYSPDGEGEPVRERVIGGRRFINVAIPGEPVIHAGGMMQIMVNKAHVLGFEAGRILTIMSSPGGDFVEVVGNAVYDESLPLPEGASLKTIDLQAPWIVPLPTPTVAFFHFGSGMRSFQGPVTLPQDPGTV